MNGDRKTLLLVGAISVTAASVILAWTIGTAGTTVKNNDFYREALPAYHALAAGHPIQFLRIGPAYVGSLVLRAPFALIPTIWGGSVREIYFAAALPCVLALAVFCTWLAAQPRRRGGIGWGSRLSSVALCVINPVLLIAMLGGHPEEILGAVLCVAGVVLATNRRSGWAGLVIGLAVVNKTWAVVAVPVVLAAMPADRRRGLQTCTLVAAAALIPITLIRAHGFDVGLAGAQVGNAVGGIFNPPQLLWWLGPRSWIVAHAREAMALVACACAALWWSRRKYRPRAGDAGTEALLLLSLVLLLRAALDPWDNLYYHVPFLLALMAYEVRAGRFPLLAVAYTFILFIVVPVHGSLHVSANQRAAVYAAIAGPTIAWVAFRAFVGPVIGGRVFAGTQMPEDPRRDSTRDLAPPEPVA